MAKIPHVLLVDTVNTQRLSLNRLIDSVGDLALLTTDANETIVAALNSVDSNQGDRVGLNTKHGSDLVDAINSALEMFDSDIGGLSNLTTDSKATVVAALNSLVTNRGVMASLATSDKTNLVASINELKLRVDLLDSDIALNLDSAFAAIVTGDQATLANAISRDSNNYTALLYLIDSATNNFAANVKNRLSAGTGLTFTESTGEFKITNTGVNDSSYGSATQIPVLTINAQGQITTASTATVAGVSSVIFNDSTGVLTISTADGQTFSSTIGVAAFSTDQIVEGSTNLYYTKNRVDSAIDARVIKSYVDALLIDADTLDGQPASYYLDQGNFVNAPAINDAVLTIDNDTFMTGSGTISMNDSIDTTITISHPASGVIANTYGTSGTEDGKYIKSVTVDGRGHITAITDDDFDDRFDNYLGWTVRDGDTTTSAITSGNVLQFEGGTGITVTGSFGSNPKKITISSDVQAAATLLIKNSAGTTVKTINGI